MTFVYNLPNITQLNLTMDIVQNIYLERITMWNDPSLQAININSQLPNESIIAVVNKNDVTADTYVFTSKMSSRSSEWKQRYGIIIDTWGPNVTLRLTGNSPVAAVFVNATPYSIGYSSAAIRRY